jgi:hypothetical protein
MNKAGREGEEVRRRKKKGKKINKRASNIAELYLCGQLPGEWQLE